MVSKVSDLKDEKLENAVREKLKSQHIKAEARGIILKENSSLAQSIVSSLKFNDYMSKNAIELAVNHKLPNTSWEFKPLNSGNNNYLALHNVDVENIYLYNRTTVHMTIIDTVDYNFGEKQLEIPRKIQEHQMLENYYIIIKIAVPFEKWKKYLE